MPSNNSFMHVIRCTQLNSHGEKTMTIRHLLVLLLGLIGLNSLPAFADTQEVYRFERLWPVLQQPWYFSNATDIVVDKQGYVYVADTFNRQVKKLTSDGHLIYQKTINTDPSIVPYRLAIDSLNNLYVLSRKREGGNQSFQFHFIQVFDALGGLLKDWGENPNLVGDIALRDLAIDSQDNVYLAQSDDYRAIKKFSSDGELLDEWPVVTLKEGIYSEQLRIAIDNRDEFIYLLDQASHLVLKYTAEGQLVKQWGELGDEPGQFDTPDSIIIDNDNNIYVTDSRNNRVQKFTQDGEFITQWGNEDNLNADKWKQILADDSPIGNMFEVMITPIFGDLIKEYILSLPKDKLLDDFIGNPLVLFTLLNSDTFLPEAIAVDAKNELYIAYNIPDLSIRKYTSKGELITQWGNRGKTGNQLNIALAIAKDSQDFIYMTDLLNHRVVKTTADGQFVTSWGELGKADGQFIFPYGIAIDSKDNVYVVDSGNFRIQKFSSAGEFIEQWGGFDSGILQLMRNKFLYLLNINALTEQLNSLLNEKGCPNNHCFFGPTHIAIDKHDNVYVVDSLRVRINKFSSDGQFMKAFGKRGDNDGEFHLPMGITVDNSEQVYVTDLSKHQLQKFTTNGEWLDRWGECVLKKVEGVSSEVVLSNQNNACLQTAAESADIECQCTFESPYDVATDDDGNVYVSDGEHERIQKFNSEGEPMTQWGELGTLPGQFSQPGGITVGHNGKVYVTDLTNNNIQVFNSTLYDSGKAIIVAGGLSKSDALWNATQMVANFAYRTLVYQGFTKDSIYYINANTGLDLDNNGEADDVDAQPTQQNLKNAIINWATDADNLTIFLTDHGGDKTFTLKGEKEQIDAADLNKWLTDWQQNKANDQVKKVKIIYDACHSGSFLPALKGPNRIVITSAKAEEEAYFLSQGSLSFSNYFWTHVFNGLNLKEAFSDAKRAIDYYLPQNQSAPSQTPLLDANGDGSENQPDDFEAVKTVTIGNGTQIITGHLPIISVISPQKPLQLANTDDTASITVEVTDSDSDNIARVWAIVRSPSEVQLREQDEIGQPILELPSFEFKRLEGNRYKGSYDFKQQGSYEIAIYARDSDLNTSKPETISVSVGPGLKRKAIILVGGSTNNPLLTEMAENTSYAYKALKYQGYQDNEIYYLSNISVPDVQASVKTADWFNVRHALGEWAQYQTRDLVLYLTGIDNETGLILNDTDTLSFQALDAALDELQQNHIAGTLTVIYEGAHGQAVLPALTPPTGKQRIVISNSGQPTEKCVDNQLLSLTFGNLFWQKILHGADVLTAFNVADDETGQMAQLDDNGDGVYSTAKNRDGLVAIRYTIGIGIVRASHYPSLIRQLSSEQFLQDETTATFWAEITAPAKVWAVITPLSNICGTVEISMEPVPDIPGRYQATYDGFTNEDSYSIAIYARNNNTRRLEPARTTYIHQRKPNYLISSSDVYRNGEQAQIKLPPLPTEDYNQYLAVGLPNQSLFVLKGFNEFVPLDNAAEIPAYQKSSGQPVIDVRITDSLPRGEYSLYLVRQPKGSALELPPVPQTLGVSGFLVE